MTTPRIPHPTHPPGLDDLQILQSLGPEWTLLIVDQAFDTHCLYCLKNIPDLSSGTTECYALERRYYELHDKASNCFAYEDRPAVVLADLDRMVQYALSRSGRIPRSLRLLRKKMAHKVNLEADRQAHEAFLEESHRKGKPGGGEKGDKVHKLFGPNRLKDNRPVYPYNWDGT